MEGKHSRNEAEEGTDRALSHGWDCCCARHLNYAIRSLPSTTHETKVKYAKFKYSSVKSRRFRNDKQNSLHNSVFLAEHHELATQARTPLVLLCPPGRV